MLPSLKPSGTIFVWLYWNVPGWKFKLRSVIRRAVVPLPLAVRRAVSYAFVPVVALGGRGGASFRRGGGSLRELAVVQLDYFTPKSGISTLRPRCMGGFAISDSTKWRQVGRA